ncbi:universal stress protein UspA [Dictyobacter vulcani]|uniref:Universal stress protein UspA n=1 Tax=Dictyobacter vulcani TaxID=2607529 RepID=A0A5J4KU11_9CHLR|nr:universal stress protein [Dictyobacter vulcani]GER90672.1 universal stress protein UspA [Dictyobacter vulcani]
MATQNNHTPAFQNILVPLDGSMLAEEAIPLAADIARNTGGTLILLHVVLPSSCVPIQPLESLEIVRKLEAVAMDNASVYMQRVITAEHLDTLKVQTETQVGGAPKTIIDFAQTHQVDLIVMRSHGETGFKRWFLGSVAQQVLRHSPVPVLVVREKYTSIKHPMHSPRILVALDGTNFAESAIIPAARLCAALAQPGQGAIHLMTAVRRNGWLNGEDKATVEQMDQTARADARSYLNNLEQRFSQGDLANLHIHVTTSVVAYTDILEIVKRIIEESNCIGDVPGYSGCDFIAMATHKQHGFQQMLLGSYTEDVFDATRQPLLIVHTSGPQEKVLESHRNITADRIPAQ